MAAGGEPPLPAAAELQPVAIGRRGSGALLDAVIIGAAGDAAAAGGGGAARAATPSEASFVSGGMSVAVQVRIEGVPSLFDAACGVRGAHACSAWDRSGELVAGRLGVAVRVCTGV
jgi:hypothetical protein